LFEEMLLLVLESRANLYMNEKGRIVGKKQGKDGELEAKFSFWCSGT
jgi:hypothetical protein